MTKIDGLIKQASSSASGSALPASKKRRAPDEDVRQETQTISWESAVTELHAIEQKIEKQEVGRKLPFSTYESAAVTFSRAKESLLTRVFRECFEKNDFKVCMEGIQRLFQIIHPFPLYKEILGREIGILDQACTYCQQASAFPAYATQAAACLRQLKKAIADLKYNHLTITSQNTWKIFLPPCEISQISL